MKEATKKVTPWVCPKCGADTSEDAFLDDDDQGYEKYQIECSKCGNYWEVTIDTRR